MTSLTKWPELDDERSQPIKILAVKKTVVVLSVHILTRVRDSVTNNYGLWLGLLDLLVLL
jgi:hypothetical protein